MPAPEIDTYYLRTVGTASSNALDAQLRRYKMSLKYNSLHIAVAALAAFIVGYVIGLVVGVL